MLAIASLATGFVVAAITPSHGLDATGLGTPDVNDALSTLDRTAGNSLAIDDDALGKKGKKGQKGDKGHGGGGRTAQKG